MPATPDLLFLSWGYNYRPTRDSLWNWTVPIWTRLTETRKVAVTVFVIVCAFGWVVLVYSSGEADVFFFEFNFRTRVGRVYNKNSK